jgi:hypothetical protein
MIFFLRLPGPGRRGSLSEFCPSFVRKGGAKAGKTVHYRGDVPIDLIGFSWLALYGVVVKIRV